MSEAGTWPDIEVYIRHTDLASVKVWLDQLFGLRTESRRGDAVHCQLGESGMEAVIVENAAEGGYTTVWFTPNLTAWRDDRACARDAFARFGNEVRCTAGPWQEGDSLEDGWLSISDRGERTINW